MDKSPPKINMICIKVSKKDAKSGDTVFGSCLHRKEATDLKTHSDLRIQNFYAGAPKRGDRGGKNRRQ